MEIRQLIYFMKVAELGSLTRAANALNLTQPALGMQIRKLEDHLKVELIERHSRGARLTDAGREFDRHAKRIVENLEEVRTLVGRFGSEAHGTVRIGVTPSMGKIVVPTLHRTCAERFPGITLKLVQGFSDQLSEMIRDKQLDFAVTYESVETEAHESLPLYVEQFMLVGSPDLIPDGDTAIPLSDLAKVPMVLDSHNLRLRSMLDARMEQLGHLFENALEVAAMNLRRELVVQGCCACIATRGLFAGEIARGEVVVREIDMPDLAWELNLTTRRVESMSNAEAVIRSHIIAIVDEAIARGTAGWGMPSRCNSEAVPIAAE